MQVTEIKVFPIAEEKLKAFVSIVFDHCFMVNDIKIIQGKDGLFISMPSRRKRNGKFKDVAHPLNNDTRRMIEDQVLQEYERVVVGGVGSRREPAVKPAEPVEQAAEGAAEGGGESTEGSRESTEEKTLEEVAEMHLRDSFWNP